jgi:predicted RNase H-like nuclease (RuvC/YqgF family)
VPSDPLIDAEQYLQCMDEHMKALSTAVDGCKNSLSSVGSNYRGWIDAYRGEVQRNHFRGQENNFLQDQARHMTAEIRNLKASNKQLSDELDSVKQAQPQPRAKTARLELLVKQYETVRQIFVTLERLSTNRE